MGAATSLPEVTQSLVPSVALLAGTVAATLYLVKNSRKPEGVPPGPRRVPIIGTLAFNAKQTDTIHMEVANLAKKYGPIFSMYLGNVLVIIISDYSILREVFVAKGIETAGRPDSAHLAVDPNSPLYKGIILSSYSEEWKRQRNTALNVMRALGWGKASIERKIQEECQAMIEELGKNGDRPFYPAPVYANCVSNVISSLLFGKRFPPGCEEFKFLNESLERMLQCVAVVQGLSNYVVQVQWTAKYKQCLHDLDKIMCGLQAVYSKKINEAKSRLKNGYEDEDFMTLYLKELEKQKTGESRITEDWLIKLVSDFFVAGSETTATTMTFAPLYMANHPTVQERIYQEITKNIPSDAIISLQDKEKLPYTEATIMEILRMTPIAPLGVAHKSFEDIEILGYHIPAGTELWSNLYSIMHDPKTFPEPEVFRPERFLNDKQDTVERHESWIPFSMGRRTCLGEQLARQELFLFFSNMIRNFKILPPEGQVKIDYKEVFTGVLKATKYESRFIKR